MLWIIYGYKVKKHLLTLCPLLLVMRFKAILLGLFLSIVGCNSARNSVRDYELWGIDISKHQRSVDWVAVAEHNKPNFVFLKATEGTLIIDPTYETRAKELDEQGILWGAYHFFGHRTSGKEQARTFIKTAKLKRGNIIPVLDIEYHRFMKDPKKTVREAKAFCQEIKRYYGVSPIIYCSTLFYERYLEKDFKQSDYTLWIADYTGNNPLHLSWRIWQHTDSHSIKGISGNVDRNVFNGDLQELQKLVL